MMNSTQALPTSNPYSRNRSRHDQSTERIDYSKILQITCCFFLIIYAASFSGTISQPTEGETADIVREIDAGMEIDTSESKSKLNIAKDNLLTISQAMNNKWSHVFESAADKAFDAANADFEEQMHQLSLSENESALITGADLPFDRKGFVILGMHRSGTSMLAGLMVSGMGYKVGGPLIKPASDNERGFYELLPAVLQNDEFLKHQKADWSSNVMAYHSANEYAAYTKGEISTVEGQKALEFLNGNTNSPWLQKDPRMCITLRSWLPLLNSEPAVLFTFRHPLEVAKSLNRRNDFEIRHGLRLWIMYNMRAVQNSQELCRVVSSNEKILDNPLLEVQRISDELTLKCGVPSPPRPLDNDTIHEFVDMSLQHNRNELKDDLKGKESNVAILAQYPGCDVLSYDSTLRKGSTEWEYEEKLYIKAMQIKCDLESGVAFESDYQWPEESFFKISS